MKFVVFAALLCVAFGQDLRRTHERGAPKATTVPSSCSNDNHCPEKYSCERVTTFEMKCVPIIDNVVFQPNRQVASQLLDRGIPYISPNALPYSSPSLPYGSLPYNSPSYGLPVISGPTIPSGLMAQWEAGGNALPYGFSFPYPASIPVAPSLPYTSTSLPYASTSLPLYSSAAATSFPSAISVPYTPAAVPFNPSFTTAYNQPFSSFASPVSYARPVFQQYSSAPMSVAAPVYSQATLPATGPAVTAAAAPVAAAPVYSAPRFPTYSTPSFSTFSAPTYSAPTYSGGSNVVSQALANRAAALG